MGLPHFAHVLFHPSEESLNLRLLIDQCLLHEHVILFDHDLLIFKALLLHEVVQDALRVRLQGKLQRVDFLDVLLVAHSGLSEGTRELTNGSRIFSAWSNLRLDDPISNGLPDLHQDVG